MSTDQASGTSGVQDVDYEGNHPPLRHLSSPSTEREMVVSPTSLVTLFAANNGQAGNSFDLTAKTTSLIVVGWDINIDKGTTPVSIYYRTGTAQGFERNPAGWTLLGTADVTSSGSNLPAGQKIGIILVTADRSPSIQYTDGFAVYQNVDLLLSTVSGISGPPPAGSVFSPRRVNTRVYYLGSIP